MEGYFETIGGRGDGIVGSAAGFFWFFFSLVVRKSFFLNCLNFSFLFAQSRLSLFLFFFFFLLECMV